MAARLSLEIPVQARRAAEADTIALRARGAAAYPLHHDLEKLFISPGPGGAAAPGFLLAALGVWAADKLLPRSRAADAWTRQIVLHLPVPEPWAGLGPALARLLNFLTGDEWTLKPRPRVLGSWAGKSFRLEAAQVAEALRAAGRWWMPGVQSRGGQSGGNEGRGRRRISPWS